MSNHITKICRGCWVEKDLSDFHKRTKARDGHKTRCKNCAAKYAKEYSLVSGEKRVEYNRQWRKNNPNKAKNHRLLRRYQISFDEYTAMLNEQNNVCAICLTKKENEDLSVDHDRSCCSGDMSCGKCVRGLLCRNCNSCLGLLQDDVVRLSSAITYLNKRKKGRNV